MLQTLRARLLASYILIVVIILATALAALAVTLLAVEDGLVQTRLRAAVPVTASLVSALIAQGMTPQAIADELQDHLPASQARLLIIERGVVVGDSGGGDLVGQTLPLPVPQRMADMMRPPAAGTFRITSGGAFNYAVGSAMSSRLSGRGPFGGRSDPVIVAIIVPRSPWQGLMSISQPLLWSAALALLLGLVLAWLISRSVSRPLGQIAAATNQVAQGDLDLHLDVQGPREVVQLAGQFQHMAAEVKRSRQAQREFIANVSHDLKTPLTSIQGFSQAMLEGVTNDPARSQRAAQVIHGEALRMGRLVDQLLDLAKLEAGQVHLTTEPVQVWVLLDRVIERMALLAERHEVVLEAPEMAQVWVRGDGDRLAQVFTNLLDNAIRHTPPGGRVACTIQPTADGQDVELTVRDTGAGISPEDLPHVFERFYQADKSRHQGSSGLGLAIVREIVKAHGGEVAVASPAGKGTVFTVRLPIDRQGKDAPPSGPGSAYAARSVVLGGGDVRR